MAKALFLLLSCVFLASCALAELIYGPGGRLLDTACKVDLPPGATAYGTDRIVLADGTVIPYPACAHHTDAAATANVKAAPNHDLENEDRKREANGWNEYYYFYPGYALDQFNGDWTVPTTPGLGYRGQLLYFFTALEPASQDLILQPVLWYGVSPAGGGSNWYVAVWEVHSNNAYTVSQVVQVYPGQTIHTTMVRYPGQFWNCNMFVNGNLVTAGNFADRDYNIAFTTLEVYNVGDCYSLPYAQTTNFYNLQVHQAGGNFVTTTWVPKIEQSDCGQSLATIGTVNGLTYGLNNLLSPMVFDAGFYKANNPDLPWSDYGNLANHWLNSGVYEGRIAVASFFVNEYKAIYPDLAGLPNRDAISHYTTNGYLEGRVGRIILHPLAYNYIQYAQRYSDLLAAFGYDRLALGQHWSASGINEGRQAISTFSAPAYLSFYPDLQAAFGGNLVLATQHWVQNGHAEGRRGV